MSATTSTKARVTTATLREMKSAGDPIVMVTAYDASSARLAEEAGVDSILVGDSLGMVVLGHDSTLPVTLDDMLRHTAAVVRGTSRALIVADMPFLTFQVSPEEAIRNAGRLLAEAGATAVKLEGGVSIARTVERMVAAGIPVMGHLGLTPQSVNVFGGFKVQGRQRASAIALVQDALALEAAGAFALVLELVPAELAAMVSEELSIPTIGIGAGDGCDGQVQVFHDLLGLGTFKPKHAKRYADVGDAIRTAIGHYAAEVRSGAFPAEENLSHLDADTLGELETALPLTPGEG
ncbi:MAG: 3-methyl-2-oxobutanoate hydroxymethyltransferase [Actinomycetia bacterium]|nr:3-methyl-2-oxobutanoate hydroxymethyltransferase [Actinomycetes bacterium]